VLSPTTSFNPVIATAANTEFSATARFSARIISVPAMAGASAICGIIAPAVTTT
jgi:hypothetical protein